MVGVLEWADANTFASFDKQGRLDTKIMKFFQESGVPSNHILYLKDKQATTKAVREAFAPFLKQAAKGDTLFFYYCGHGYKNDAKKVCFANYQGADWSAEEIVRTVNENFAGNTAIFAADCCNSGGLAVEVQKYKNRNYAALNSVVPKDLSTGNWTFSNALLYGFQGKNFVDKDNNGQITLSELANYIDEEMAIVEGQKAAYFVPANMKSWAITSSIAKKKNPRIGERVLADYGGEDYLGFIVGTNAEGKFNVRFYSYTNNETDWVEASRLKQFVCSQNFAVGTAVKIYYPDEKKWYAAKVLKKFSCLHYVHYDEYGSEWDEWVSPDNIKKK
jgi:Caspase domain/RNA binding activity-knot of a chromodomain